MGEVLNESKEEPTIDKVVIPEQRPVEPIEEPIIDKEVIPEHPPIDPRAEAFRPILHRMFELMQENDIYAIKIFTPKGTIDLANADPKIEEELERQVLEFYKYGSSGFFIFEGAHPDKKTVLFKLKLNDVDPRSVAHNELHFFQDLVPELTPYLKDKKVKIPDLLNGGFSEEGHSFIVTEFAEGETLGAKPFDAEEPLTIEEFQALIELVKYTQETLTPDKVQELSPELTIDSSLIDSTYGKHLQILKMYEDKWNDVLEPEYIDKLRDILERNKVLFENQPLVFNNQDINPANIIRTENGITVIDWERLRQVPNPAAAYNHIIESHWRFPELQDEMVKRVLDLNKDIPNFKELFRTEMLFYKYSFIYRSLSKNPNLPEKEQEEARAGLDSVLRFIKNAVDNEGPWKND